MNAVISYYINMDQGSFIYRLHYNVWVLVRVILKLDDVLGMPHRRSCFCYDMFSFSCSQYSKTIKTVYYSRPLCGSFYFIHKAWRVHVFQELASSCIIYRCAQSNVWGQERTWKESLCCQNV